MFKCKNKIWIEDITELFCNTDIVPLQYMTLEYQMNSLSRLVIIIFIILFILGFDNSIYFLLLSLLFIIILYYIQKNNMKLYNETYSQKKTIEHYKPKKSGIELIDDNIVINNPATHRFCNDDVSLNFNDPEYTSPNQNLAGPPNPKTLLQPVIVPPPADLSYWKTNNLVTHSAVNEETNNDDYLSGYQISTCCGSMINKEISYLNQNNPLQTPMPCVDKRTSNSSADKIEHFQLPYIKNNIAPNQSGQVNTSCGYNPKQLLTAGLPANYPAGNCEQDQAFKKYNEDLFTQTIQPGVYTKNQVNEPINSNIGISFTQQFQPTTCQEKSNGDIVYTEHDPRIIEPINRSNNDIINDINVSNIYDPRHSGYGTSYRAYTDENIGQTKFYYDDVDAVKMPNYITRSNVDFTPYADSYGPLPKNNADGNRFNSSIRALVHDSWTRNNIEHRTDLQERLMRKINAQGWQQRKAPIRTSGSVGSNMCRR
jgi:hypothetical protein